VSAIGWVTRPVLIVATGLGFATRPRWHDHDSRHAMGALMAVLTQHNNFVVCDISCYPSHSQAAGLWHFTMPPRGHIQYYVRVFARNGFPLPSPWFSSSWVSSYGRSSLTDLTAFSQLLMQTSRVCEMLLGYSYLVAALWQVCDLTQPLLSFGPPVLSFVCIIHLKAAIAHPHDVHVPALTNVF